MTNPDSVKPAPRRRSVERARSAAPEANGKRPVHVAVLREAEAAGLLAGEKTEHVSFRAPPALVRAAKQETGVTSTSELGMLALALLAQPDPVARFFKRTRGRLGPDHDLDY